MKIETLTLLTAQADIHDYVMGLWSDGPIRKSHADGGMVFRLIDRFARAPRLFYDASDTHAEWTHFSAWWGGILRCDYDNPAIRDLRYLHEIFHAANMPHIRGANLATLEVKNFRNEREASTFTEMAIYFEFPELRPLTFQHPIFADRFLFPEGKLDRPDANMLRRWREESDMVFQELLYRRTTSDAETDPGDPQIVWLRRYAEQGQNWLRVWQDRYSLVEDAMVTLKRQAASGDRAGAGQRHVDWLLSPAVTEGGDIPFRREAIAFRTDFDNLIAAYDRAMQDANQVAVKSKAGS
jgi:hypothetical protein